MKFIRAAFLLLMLFLKPEFAFSTGWVWAKKAGISVAGNVEGWNVATDRFGNIYGTGYFTGDTILFGSNTIVSTAPPGSTNFFLVKYDSAGNFKWAKTTEYSGGNTLINLAVDRSGNVLVSGLFLNSDIIFGSFVLHYSMLGTADNPDFFLVKYDSSGNVLWARNGGGCSKAYNCSVATDPSGNVFLTGTFQSPEMYFGSDTLTNYGLVNVFLAKYNPSGSLEWARGGGSVGYILTTTGLGGFSYSNAIATDNAGNVVIEGAYNTPVNAFGADTLYGYGPDTTIVSYEQNLFLVKYSSSGTVSWARKGECGYNGEVLPNALVIDGSGNEYITGQFIGDSLMFTIDNLVNFDGNGMLFLAKFNQYGNELWALNAKKGGGAHCEGFGLALDSASNIWMSGSFDSLLIFGKDTLYQPGLGDNPMFIAAFSPTGNKLFATSLPGGGDDINGIAADNSGNEYIASDYGNNNFVIGKDTLTLSNAEDYFMARLKIVIPDPGFIAGPENLCVGSTLTVSDTIPGGTWSCSNGTASIRNGIVTGRAPGVDTIIYTVSNNYTSVSATKVINIFEVPVSGVLNGTNEICVGSQFTVSDPEPGIWSATNPAVIVVGGWVTGIYTGVDTIIYNISNYCGVGFKTLTVTVNPLPDAGVLNGLPVVCIGSIIHITDTATGGTWSFGNGNATVHDGIVNGLIPGTDTLFYIDTTICGRAVATKLITISPLPDTGIITGPVSLCVNDSILLNDTVTGGFWSSAFHLISDSGGFVKGLIPGNDIAIYTVTNGWCNLSATKNITVNPMPDPGIISGIPSVCIGSITRLTDPVPGGLWNTTNGSVSISGGNITGLRRGADTVTYMVTNHLCTSVAIKTIVVDTLPDPGTITGPDSVCVGDTIRISDTVNGGVWSQYNLNATFSDGIIRGVTGGTDTFHYAKTNSCGTRKAAKPVVINPLPFAGILSGGNAVCAGSTEIISSSVIGGYWFSFNSNASIAGGALAGINPGKDTIIYTVTNACGIDTASKIVTINPLPDSGLIMGPSSVCAGAQIHMSDSVGGGNWSTGNSNANISTIGIVTGVNAGTVTISYTVTTICRSAIATKTITINPLPYAGVIAGLNTVCVNSQLTLTDPILTGNWISSNANATLTRGLVTGVSHGTDTIYYMVNNVCGTDTASKYISINPLPDSGFISGLSSFCADTFIVLSDSVAGGIWSAINSVVSISTAGLVRGLSAGTDTISYAVTNSCGTAIAIKTVTVYPMPQAGTINGLTSLCVGDTTRLLDGSPGGMWMALNANADISGGLVTGIVAGMDTFVYSVTNMCGTDLTSKTMLINPLPYSGVISGFSHVCLNESIQLTDTTTGGAWVNNNVLATFSDGVLTGIIAGNDSVMYLVTNVCGTDTALKVVKIDPLPDAGVITGPDSICKGAVIVLTETVTGGKWKGNNPSAASIDSISGTLTALAQGIDSITYYPVIDSNGCKNSTGLQVVVIVSEDFSIYSKVSPVKCNGSKDGLIALSVLGGEGPYRFTWSTGDSTATLENLPADTFTVLIKNLASLCSAQDTFILTQPDSLLVTSVVSKEYCKRTDGTIALTVSGGTMPYSFLWQDNSTGYEKTGLPAGEYSVVVQDSNQCKVNLSFTIDEDTCLVIVHDALTPNGDGINDEWVIEGITFFPENEVQVFDKYGDMVFEQKNYNNTWQGKSGNGMQLPDGTYFYVLKLNATNVTGGKNVINGSILLKR